MKRIVQTGVLVTGLVCCLCLAPAAYGDDLNPGPSPVGPIEPASETKVWFHIDDDTMDFELSEDAHDYDCNWTTEEYIPNDEDPADFLLPALTEWSADPEQPLTNSTGTSTTWEPDEQCGADIYIKAKLVDLVLPDINDVNPTISCGPYHTFRVGVHFYWRKFVDQAQEGDNDEDTLWCNGGVSSLAQYLDLDCDIASGIVTGPGIGLGGRNTFNEATNKFLYAKWTLVKDPSNASLDGRSIKSDLSASGSGSFSGSAWDDDLLDGEASVSVGLAGGAPAGIGVAISLDVQVDRAEAVVGAGFHVDDAGTAGAWATHTLEEIELRSEDGGKVPPSAKTGDGTASYSDAITLSGIHGIYSELKLSFRGEVDCDGESEFTGSPYPSWDYWRSEGELTSNIQAQVQAAKPTLE